MKGFGNCTNCKKFSAQENGLGCYIYRCGKTILYMGSAEDAAATIGKDSSISCQRERAK